MANVKEAQMAKDELLDNIQKFVLCGRTMLDAIEDLTNLYFCTIPSKNEAVNAQAKEPAAESPAKTKAEKHVSEAPAPQQAEAPRTATMEEVRGLLAEKSRSGFRAEVKALLSAHGVEKLSDITDPAELGTLLGEAEQIGVTDG